MIEIRVEPAEVIGKRIGMKTFRRFGMTVKREREREQKDRENGEKFFSAHFTPVMIAFSKNNLRKDPDSIFEESLMKEQS